MVQYRPKFIFWTSFLAQVPLQLFFAFWAGGFFGGMITLFLPSVSTRISVYVGNPFTTIGLATLLLFPVVTLFGKWLNYRNTCYRVYLDRLEVEEGFFTRHRKDVLVSSVREVNLRRGILQRLVGIGSVYVATTATGQGWGWQSSALIGATSTFGSGIMLMDLENSEEAYRRIRQLVDARPKD
jgi:membrane protein YdbS with pleckstrin-like domain